MIGAPFWPVSRMQLLFDFLPIIAFFVAYKLADIYVATGVIIVASVLQVSIYWLWKRRVNPMHLVSSGLVLVFGEPDTPDTRQVVHHVEADRRQLAVRVGVPGSMWRRISDRPLIQRMMNAAGGDLHAQRCTLAPAELALDRLLRLDGCRSTC